MKNKIQIVLLLCAINLVNAQEKKFTHHSSWNGIILKVKIDSTFYVSSEFHFRRTNFLKDREQFIGRPSVHFTPNKTYDFALGYSYIRNYSFSDYSNPINANEHNIWQQVQLNHTHKKLNFKHRFRLEEIFIDKIVQSINGVNSINGSNYKNRFRYRFTLTKPIMKVFENKKIYVKIFDEFFINLQDGIRPKSLNQNWFYIGLDYPLANKIGFGIGYHNIGLNSSNNTFITNHILQTTVTYSVN